MITNSFINYTLLEWNEKQQLFHINRVMNNVIDAQPDTNGYKTVHICATDEEAFLLTEYIYKHIKKETTRSEGLRLSTAQVKRHIKAVVKLTEEFARLDLHKISAN